MLQSATVQYRDSGNGVSKKRNPFYMASLRVASWWQTLLSFILIRCGVPATAPRFVRPSVCSSAPSPRWATKLETSSPRACHGAQGRVSIVDGDGGWRQGTFCCVGQAEVRLVQAAGSGGSVGKPGRLWT